QHRKHDVNAQQALAGAHLQTLAVVTPDPIAPDLHPNHVVVGGDQPVAHGGARGQRYLVLGGAAPGEHCHGERAGYGGAHRADQPEGAGAGVVGVVVVCVGVGVVVVLVGVVVVVFGASVPTVSVTVAPLRAGWPAPGLCLSTTPTLAGSVTVAAAVFGTKPAPPSAAAACVCVVRT